MKKLTALKSPGLKIACATVAATVVPAASFGATTAPPAANSTNYVAGEGGTSANS